MSCCVVPGLRHVQRPDHREGGQVDQLGSQAGASRGGQQVLHAVAARCDHQDAHAATLLVVDPLQQPVVQHRLLDRHRKLLLRLEADRRVELLLVSMAGSSMTRTAIFWLATPRRTFLGRSLSRKNARSRSASASTSTTSPSWKRPGPRLVVAARTSTGLPFWLNSAAATKPGSMSSPTTERVFDLKSPIP